LKTLCLVVACIGWFGCGETATSECGFAQELLPFDVGDSWTYTVTELSTGERTQKSQRIESAPDHPDYGPVVKQITDKANGRADSLLRKEDGQVLRFEQQDFDLNGVLERTTVYDPARLRIDESDARIADGATFTDSYQETTTDAVGGGVVTAAVVDEWEVLGVDVSCESVLGSFECIQLRRVRTAGGTSDKQFFFALGIGKVKEVGTKSVEDLVDCN
jgi:hypothetical protein